MQRNDPEPDEYQQAAEFYDHFGPYRDRQDVRFFVDEARGCGGTVLELGCGTGRVLIPTARAGVEIVGVDRSEHMLRRCREKLAREPGDVQARTTLLAGDIRDFRLDRSFRLITLPFRPFQHLLSVEEQFACLASVHRHLEEGGRMILDVFNPSLTTLTTDALLAEHASGDLFDMPDGRRVQRRERVLRRDLAAQIVHIELIYHVTHADGRQEQHASQFPMRYLFRYEAEHLLARAGFEVEALYADYDRTPFGTKDPCELIFMARKR